MLTTGEILADDLDDTEDEDSDEDLDEEEEECTSHPEKLCPVELDEIQERAGDLYEQFGDLPEEE